MPSEPTFDAIAALIDSIHRDGEALICTFTCPVSGKKQRASARVVPEGDFGGLGAISAVSRGLGQALRAALGYREVGDGSSKVMPAIPKEALKLAGDPEEQQAVVRAFQQLSPPFLFDARQGRWISTEAAGDLSPAFSRQLAKAPVKELSDRKLLARMLTDVAKIDGRVARDEWAFLADYVLSDVGTIETFMDQPQVTAQDLALASQGAARETMLMLTWAMALADQSLAENETQLLDELGQGLGIEEARRAELGQAAREFAVDQALPGAITRKGERGPKKWAELVELATRIGLDEQVAAELENRYRMRSGL